MAFVNAMGQGACQAEPRHVDLGLARESGLDCLVLHLNDLISTAFSCATGTVEILQPVGLELLTKVIGIFSEAVDPDVEESLLLEVYQAQIGAAIRPAFAPDAMPEHTAALSGGGGSEDARVISIVA